MTGGETEGKYGVAMEPDVSLAERLAQMVLSMDKPTGEQVRTVKIALDHCLGQPEKEV